MSKPDLQPVTTEGDRFRITCPDGEDVFVASEQLGPLMRLSNETGVGPATVSRLVSGVRGSRPPRPPHPDDA